MRRYLHQAPRTVGLNPIIGLDHPTVGPSTNRGCRIPYIAATQEKMKRILLTSTSEVYGDPLEHPQKEYWGNVTPIACSHAGLIDEGWKEFNGMYSKYGIIPSGKHYACMVDLLGRGGRFEDVRNFIIQMPLQPTASLWGALLSYCRTHRNVEMAEYAAGHLLELQPENLGNYVILSNIYASAGRWDGVDRVRKMMNERGVRKQPGCSWIEVRNRIHGFTAKNPSHPDMDIVTRTLLDLMATLEEEGYIPKTKVVDVV